MDTPLSFHPTSKIIKLYAAGFAVLVILGRLVTSAIPYELYFWGLILLVGGAWLFYLHLERVTTLYTVDGVNLCRLRGIFSKTHSKIPVSRITNYEVKRTLIDRFLGVGDVLIDTAGGDTVELEMIELEHRDIQALVARLDALLAQNKGMSDKTAS